MQAALLAVLVQLLGVLALLLLLVPLLLRLTAAHVLRRHLIRLRRLHVQPQVARVPAAQLGDGHLHAAQPRTVTGASRSGQFR